MKQIYQKSVAWPAMHHLSAQWIPPSERGTFLTSYLGSSVCIAVFYPLFGVIMSFWSWELVFYVSGVFGTIWYMAWLYFVYDSPDKHPRIDPAEKLYIQQALSDSVHVGKVNNNQKTRKFWTLIVLPAASDQYRIQFLHFWTNYIESQAIFIEVASKTVFFIVF